MVRSSDSILICQKKQLPAIQRILHQPLSAVSRKSQKRSRLRLIVEAVCSGLCENFRDLALLTGQVYFETCRSVDEDVKWLIAKKLIAVNDDDGNESLKGTQLGRAVLASSLTPEIALLVFADLERGSRGLILNTELHLLYLVTPLNNVALWTHYMDWDKFYSIWSKLPKRLRRVGHTVGVSDRFFLERIQGRLVADDTVLQIHLRFISALALFDLINEHPLSAVAQKLNINRGALQSLQQQAATYACMVVAFCDRLGWVYLRAILDGFCERIAFGVRKDLTELVRLPGIDATRARAFHAANITTIAALANTSRQQVAKILRSAFECTQSIRRLLPYNLTRRELITMPLNCEDRLVANLTILLACGLINMRNELPKNCNYEGHNRWLKGEELMSDLEAAELLLNRARANIAASIRDMGLFSESQLCLLLAKSNADKLPKQSNNNSAEKNLSKEKENSCTRSFLELSSRDFFDMSLINAEIVESSGNAMLSKSEDSANNDFKENAIINETCAEMTDLDIAENSHIVKAVKPELRNTLEEINYVTDKVRRISLYQPLKKVKSIFYSQEPDLEQNVSAALSSVKAELLEQTNQPSKVLINSSLSPVEPKASANVDFLDQGSIIAAKKEENEFKLQSERGQSLHSTEKIIACCEHENAQSLKCIPYSQVSQSELILLQKDQLSKMSALPLFCEVKLEKEINFLGDLEVENEKTNSEMKFSHGNANKVEKLDSTVEFFSETASDSFLAAVDTQPVFQEKLFNKQILITQKMSDNARKKGSDDDVDSTKWSASDLISTESSCSSLVPSAFEMVSESFSPKGSSNMPSTMNNSGDLFDLSIASSCSATPPMAHLKRLKRIHRVQPNASPSSPAVRSPLLKQWKVSTVKSTPCSSNLMNSHNYSVNPNCSSNGPLDLPSKIIDVCRSHDEWKNFVSEARKWQKFGLCLACKYMKNLKRELPVGVALCPADGLPVFISLEDAEIYGNEEEENLYPSFTPMDSISISERIAFIESLFTSSQQKYVFDLLSFARKIASQPFTPQIAQKINNFNCLQMLAFIARKGALNLQPLSIKDLFEEFSCDTLAKIKILSTQRNRSSVQAYLFVNIFLQIFSLAVLQASPASVELELKAIVLLARMEATGIAFDRNKAKIMILKVRQEMSALEHRGGELAGVPFNFDSPSEVAHVLFVRMKLPPPEGQLGSSKRHYSTNKAVLEKLAKKYEIAEVILKWRRLSTAESKSLNSLIEYCLSDGRIHASFFPYTQTGRVQSTHPNVQNVQKSVVIDTLSVRSLFVAATGSILVAADYCQLEMRILAHFTKDQNLKQLFLSKGDFFQTMVESWNNNPSLKFQVDRPKVKQLCYGLIYGMGAGSLSEQLGISKADAKSLLDGFFKQFPKVRSWIDQTLEKHHRKIDVTTLLGRKRPGNSIVVGNASEKARSDRCIINYVIQGTASEIFKLALTKIEERIREFNAKIVMQVHDEVIVEAPEVAMKEVAEVVKKLMCGSIPIFSIPLNVKISVGHSWGDLQELLIN